MKNNRLHDDPALRKALQNIQQKAERQPLSGSFESEVMNKISHGDRRWRSIAAAVIGILLVSGVTLAAIRMATGDNHRPPMSDKSVTIRESQPASSVADNGIVRFDNAPLDSILNEIAAHYHQKVAYRNERLQQLHFLIEWDKQASLDEFINLINNFDGITVSVNNDTITVE